MSNDFYLSAAQARAAQLEAERAAALADLAAHRANGDTESAAASIQQLADIEAARANLSNLANGYVQSQNPPLEPELTQEERNAKPWNRMTPQDALELARTSKYGRNLDFNDPNVAAGWHEANRRRARGE